MSNTPSQPSSRPFSTLALKYRPIIIVALLGTGFILHERSVSSPPTSPFTMAHFQGPTMGTTYSIKVVTSEALPKPLQTKLTHRIEARLESINQAMSTYRPESELSRFNRHATSKPFPVSADTYEVVQLALGVAHESLGAFDPTVGPLVNAWGFGPTQPQNLPKQEELNDIQTFVGYKKIRLTPSRHLEKSNPRLQLDLSAIAKGYAVDKLSEEIDALGIVNSMVEIGGEVRTRGHNIQGQPWRIGIESPHSTLNQRQSQILVALRDKAMATSGNYRNFKEHRGRRYAHIIDPRSAKPVSHHLASVSVIASTCAKADAYATTIQVLGPKEGLEFALKTGLAARLVSQNNDNTFTIKMTPSFDKFHAIMN